MRRDLAFALVGVFVGCALVSASWIQNDPPQRAYRVAEAPADDKPAIAKAQAAFREFQDTLIGRMNEELGRGGPAAALSVYRDEAVPLTARIAARERIRMGRTSHRLRNPQNRPPAWAAPYVNEAAAAKASNADTLVVDVGPLVAVLAPLETKEVCTLCHGPAEALPPAIIGAIRANYPGDRATGFQAGQVRGWIWAEVPRR